MTEHLTVAATDLTDTTRAILEAGDHITDEALEELRAAATPALLGREGWLIDEDGHSHYYPADDDRQVDPVDVDWGYFLDDVVVAQVCEGWVADDGNAEIDYPHAESGAEAAQDYVDDGFWGDATETSWITVYVWRAVDGLTADGELVQGTLDRDSYTITLEPDEPECVGDEHDWQSPLEVVGGIKENPGVWGHGGGVIITEVCAHCGHYRDTDTWAQNKTGEQGLRSVGYREPDEASLAWIDESVEA